MKQWKKYCIGMLVMTTLLFVTACGNSAAGENPAAPNGNPSGPGYVGDKNQTDDGMTDGDNATGGTADIGPNIDDYLFDTDGDGVYDRADVDGDGLLEEIGRDANDVVDDIVNDVTESGDTMLENHEDGMTGQTDNGNTSTDKESGNKTP